MKILRFIKSLLDRLLVFLALSLLLVMVLVIIYQVFSRQILQFTPSWSEELSRILFVWVAFLGIAYGFKEKLHIGVGVFVNMLPENIQKAMDFFSKILIVGLSLLMIYYGWQFTVLMQNSTLPGLKISSSYLYAIIPLTGFYTLLYGIELFFKDGLHQEYTDEGDVE